MSKIRIVNKDGQAVIELFILSEPSNKNISISEIIYKHLEENEGLGRFARLCSIANEIAYLEVKEGYEIEEI